MKPTAPPTPFCLRFKTRRGGSSRKPFSSFLSPLATHVPEYFHRRWKENKNRRILRQAWIWSRVWRECRELKRQRYTRVCVYRGPATWNDAGGFSLVSTAECLCLRLVVDVACRASLLEPGCSSVMNGERRNRGEMFRGTGLFFSFTLVDGDNWSSLCVYGMKYSSWVISTKNDWLFQMFTDNIYRNRLAIIITVAINVLSKFFLRMD